MHINLVKSDFNFLETLRFLNRSENECTHRVQGETIYKWIAYNGKPLLFSIGEEENGLDVKILLGKQKGAEQAVEKELKQWFDLERNLKPFYKLAKGDKILSEIVKANIGLRLIGMPNLFEALCWSIIGQQINLRFAYSLKKRIVEQFGQGFEYKGETFHLFPNPATISKLKVEDFQPFQFSRRKAEYIIGVAQLFEQGQLSYDLLRDLSFDESHKKLMTIRGIGNWTANYVLMKCFRRPEAFPIEDVGVHNAIKQILGMDRKPTIAELEQMAEPWGEWKAYATFYLWHSLLK